MSNNSVNKSSFTCESCEEDVVVVTRLETPPVLFCPLCRAPIDPVEDPAAEEDTATSDSED